MDPVSLSSGVAGLITLALQVSGTVAAYVIAVKDKSKNVKELHDELLMLGEVLSQLQDFLNTEQARGNSFDTNSVLQRAIVDCKARIERIGNKLKPVEGGKIARALDRMKWPFEQQDVLQMVENLRRYKETFEFAVTIKGCTILSKTSDEASQSLQEMLEVSKKISALSAQMGLSADESSKHSAQLEQVIAVLPLLNQTAEEVREMSNAVKLAELREQERRTSDILDWLAPVSSLHKHRDVQARRATGTGGWFLKHEDFQHWVQDSDGYRDLLCVGGPGVGKSVLCSFVIDELRQRYKDHDVAVVHYYCDYSEQQTQTPSHLARSLLRQLCSGGRAIPSVVAEFYQKTRNDVKDQTWFLELKRVLRRVMTTFSTCFVVIDAFDETDAQKHRVGLFEVLDTIRSVPSTTKIFATTRPHLSNIEEKFQQPVTIQVAANPDDLRQYLTSMINSHPDADHIMDEALKREVLDKLCENANGMFLLPTLHIRNILDQVTKSDVRRTLKNLSTDLTSVFSSTIERIRSLSGSRRSIAFKTLMWISHARRPLSVEEVQHALAVRFEDSDIDRDNFLSLRTILDCCCGLVEFDHESDIIRLVHFSLEEYLQSQDHDLFESGHLNVVRTCLKYMMLDSLKTLPFKNRAGFEKALGELPFLEYACHEWGHHARSVQVDDIKDLAFPLLTNINRLLVVARVRDARSPDFRKWKERMWAWAFAEGSGAGISLATSFGLTDLVRLLISQTSKPNLMARNMYGSTSLHEAAIHGYEDTAELLIAHGADLLDQNKGKATPFFLSISYGRLSMAQTLLKYDRRQLDSICRGGYTALHKAVDLGSEPLVTLLLQGGALVAAHEDRDMTPLHLAALRGHLEIARMLVLAGSLVHLEAKDRLCPLDLAASGGHRDLVELLADNGGSIIHKGGERWTPLHRAARGGHVDTVVLLLERGAQVLESSFKKEIPLHLAARSGHLETVAQLLEYDPSLKRDQLFHRDRTGSTPRVVAFYTAHYNIHKYLRAAEWAILGTEPTQANKLTAAIEAGSLSHVRRLLNKRSTSLSAPDEDGQPPLHVAIQESQLEIATFLLESGAEINARGFHGWTALHIAASLGSLALVNLCLDHEANVTVRTTSHQTALHKACSVNCLPVVQRLIAAGVDVTATNDRGMTVLHVAAHQNHIEIVRALVLEYRVDIRLRDKFGQTASMWAERSVHLDVLAFLRGEEKKVKDRERSAGQNKLERKWSRGKRWPISASPSASVSRTPSLSLSLSLSHADSYTYGEGEGEGEGEEEWDDEQETLMDLEAETETEAHRQRQAEEAQVEFVAS